MCESGGEMEENEEKNGKLPSPSASTSHVPSHSHLPLLFPFSLPTHTFPILTSHPSLSLLIITWFPRIFPLLQPTPLHIHLQKRPKKGLLSAFFGHGWNLYRHELGLRIWTLFDRNPQGCKSSVNWRIFRQWKAKIMTSWDSSKSVETTIEGGG